MSARRSQRFIQHWASLEPSLRMGITVTKRGKKSPLPGPIYAPEISIGHPTFERASRVYSFEPDLARRVLLDPHVSAALFNAAWMARLFGFHDHAVVMTRDGWHQQAAHIGTCLDLVHAAASALIAARRRTRARWDRFIEERWKVVAAAEGLAYEPEAARLTGMLDGVAPVRIEPFYGRDQMGTSAQVLFPSPLNIGLRVYRQSSSDTLSLLFGGQDVTVGHYELDDAFVMKARDEAACSVEQPRRRSCGSPALSPT